MRRFALGPIVILGVGLVALGACSGEAECDECGATSTAGSGGSGAAGATGGTGGSGGTGASGAGGGDSCMPAEVGMLCVRGEADPGGNGEELTHNGPVRFQLTPSGCYSSSCTAVAEASCEMASQTGGSIELDGAFCLLDTSPSQPGCTADCGGGGFAECAGITLPAGQYSVTIGSLQVDFEVPSTLPWGGLCEGVSFSRDHLSSPGALGPSRCPSRT